MAATLRELRGRIRSAGSIKKITKAQELIATSRIAKAQARVEAARPYSAEITNMLTELASASGTGPPAAGRAREPAAGRGAGGDQSDRGLCGALQRQRAPAAEELISLLREEGKEPVLYVVGRKALGYYSFRNWRCRPSLDRLLRAARPTRTPRRSPTTLVDGVHGRRRRRGRRCPVRTASSASTSCTSCTPSSSRC